MLDREEVLNLAWHDGDSQFLHVFEIEVGNIESLGGKVCLAEVAGVDFRDNAFGNLNDGGRRCCHVIVSTSLVWMRSLTRKGSLYRHGGSFPIDISS